MRTYSAKIKEESTKKYLMRGSKSANQLSKDIGIPLTTLLGWVKSLECRESGSKISIKKEMQPMKLSPEKKLELFIKYKEQSEDQVGEFLRRNGLYLENLEAWEKIFLSSLKPGPTADPKKKEIEALKKQIKNIQSDLNRKEKALAESSALIFLQKKMQLLLEEKDARQF